MKKEKESGFDGLLSIHTEALKENSEEIFSILEEVKKQAKSGLTSSDVRTLGRIEKELDLLNKSIDDTLD